MIFYPIWVQKKTVNALDAVSQPGRERLLDVGPRVRVRVLVVVGSCIDRVVTCLSSAVYPSNAVKVLPLLIR
jgi:hypothetical protein